MQLALFMTARCNAQCTHCAPDSGPHKSGSQPTATLFRLMDEAAALNEPDEPLYFYLTGGEAFLDFQRLVDVIAYGKSLGARVTVTTNCFWASEDGKARRMLEAVRDAGLWALGASTSRFHQQYVKTERVRRALTIARELGIYTIVKCAVTVSDREDGWAERFAEAVPTDAREIFPIVPYLRRGATLPESEYVRSPGLPEGPCPGALLTVREDGDAFACCNPGGFAEMLRVGSVHESSVAQLRERHLLGGVQQVLLEHGPIRFAREAIAQGHGGRLRSSYEGVCDLCAHIGSDPILSRIAVDMGEAIERERLEAMFRKLLDAAEAGVQRFP
jgi:pyruvate-formate lyase-activating enzyme